MACISDAKIATWTEMLDYEGEWSYDLFPVAMNAAVEQGTKNLQVARVAVMGAIASLFGKEGASALDREIRSTLARVDRVKRITRGQDPEEIEEIERDDADNLRRIFGNLSMKRG